MGYAHVMRKTVTVSEVAGHGARGIRLGAGATLEEVAKAARFYGLKWTANKVNAFEAGRISPTLPTLFAVAAALNDVTGDPVKLADLFASSGTVTVNDRLTVDAAKVEAALSGAPVEVTISELTGELERARAAGKQWAESRRSWSGPVRKITRRDYSAVLAEFSDSDKRMARSLGVDVSTAAAAMTFLWDKTFVARRDELAGPDANAQKRGRIARELKAGLRRVLDGND